MEYFLNKTIALGLYSYHLPHPGDSGFRAFCDKALLLLEAVGLKPTYFAAERDSHKGEAVPINGRSHRKSMSIGYDDASVVSFLCNPEGSDEPSFDYFSEISLSFLRDVNETLLSFSVEEDRFGLRSDKFDLILAELVSAQNWDFGYALSSREASNPPFYVLAADDGRLSKKEMDELLAWYNAAPSDRVSKVRNVHPINFVNQNQLSVVGGSGLTLRQVIESDGSSVLTQVSDNLWRWDVAADSVAELKSVVAGTGLTICGG